MAEHDDETAAPYKIGDHELSNVLRKLTDTLTNDEAMKATAKMVGAQPPRVPAGQRDHDAAHYYRTLFQQPDNDTTLVAFGKAFVPPTPAAEDAETEPEQTDVVRGEDAPEDPNASTADGLGAPENMGEETGESFPEGEGEAEGEETGEEETGEEEEVSGKKSGKKKKKK